MTAGPGTAQGSGFALGCYAHPDRPGVALCVVCRRTVCPECTTRFQGINRCSACVARLGKGAAPAAAASPVVERLAIALAYGSVVALFYALGGLVAYLGGGAP